MENEGRRRYMVSLPRLDNEAANFLLRSITCPIRKGFGLDDVGRVLVS
jgi:hypothetical protein